MDITKMGWSSWEWQAYKQGKDDCYEGRECAETIACLLDGIYMGRAYGIGYREAWRKKNELVDTEECGF